MDKHYGPETEKALKNFPFPYPKVSLRFIYAIVQIKKAAAIAHEKVGEMDPKIARSIVSACDEILSGKHDDQFVTCAIQGGAGTSINMNVNEVIASRASELHGGSKIHPNDQVNMGQSTNDVNPSALRIVCIEKLHDLSDSLDAIVLSFQANARKYFEIRKLARTHLQDAVPITFGEEFLSYADTLSRHKKRIAGSASVLSELNLGGTAVGNKLNASQKYIERVYEELSKLVGHHLSPATNFMSQTSSQTDFYSVASSILCLYIDLSKIASDIRLLSSGPRGGIGELKLAPLQAGSSIMPGKVNPVIPESINQIYYFISGKVLTIQHSAEASQLELGVMFPVLADSIISIFDMADSGLKAFSKCVNTLAVDEEKTKANLENSMALATELVPKIGYDKTAEIVDQALSSNKRFEEVVKFRI